MKAIFKLLIVIFTVITLNLNWNNPVYCSPDPDLDSIKTTLDAIIHCPTPTDSTCLDIVSGHPWSEDSKLAAVDDANAEII